MTSETSKDVLASESPNLSSISAEPQLYDLLPFIAGGWTFAVIAEHVEATAEGKAPAALPRSSAAVLGVVCVRGRMVTVLDPVFLFTGESYSWPRPLPRVIALRGDEQLALAAEQCRDTITIDALDIQPWSKPSDDGAVNAILGIARHGGEEIAILNDDQLCSAILRGGERRRRRF